MNVCTDSLKFAGQWFPSPPRWKPGLPEWMSAEYCHVFSCLLSRTPIASASMDFPGSWQYMVLVEHATQSQFDILVSAMREGCPLPDGLICLAGSGEGFHGQRGREWAASEGNIHLSVFLAPLLPLNDIATGLIVLPAVSLLQTLDSIPGLEHRAGIQWVNDILVDGSKLAGFLVHTQTSGEQVTGAVIGMGLNVETVPPVAPTMFVPSVTALRRLLPDSGVCSLSVILNRLLHALSGNVEKLRAGHAGELLEFYRERSLVMGQRVGVYTDPMSGKGTRMAEGTVVSIGDRLELMLAGNRRPVFHGRLVVESGSDKTRAVGFPH